MSKLQVLVEAQVEAHQSMGETVKELTSDVVDLATKLDTRMDAEVEVRQALAERLSSDFEQECNVRQDGFTKVQEQLDSGLCAVREELGSFKSRVTSDLESNVQARVTINDDLEQLRAGFETFKEEHSARAESDTQAQRCVGDAIKMLTESIKSLTADVVDFRANVDMRLDADVKEMRADSGDEALGKSFEIRRPSIDEDARLAASPASESCMDQPSWTCAADFNMEEQPERDAQMKEMEEAQKAIAAARNTVTEVQNAMAEALEKIKAEAL